MASVLSLVIWLIVCIWASFFVSRRIDDSGDRTVYYLLIWLLPYLGAIAAVYFAGRHAAREKTHLSDKMFDAIVDAHKAPHDG